MSGTEVNFRSIPTSRSWVWSISGVCLLSDPFGKPEINLLGDRTLYPGWIDVHDIVTQLAFALDREYYFGNFFYSIFATMDPYFEYKEKSTFRRVARVLTDPIRSLFFERVRQGIVDSDLSMRLYQLYTGID